MSDLTLRQLEYAIAVADHLHFGQAADASAVSQPGLSAQVRELERKLGVELFERTGRGVQTTTAGAELIDRARQVLLAVRELEAAAVLHHGALRGPIHVAAIPTMAPYLLPALVRLARSHWPLAELHLLELQTTELVSAIEHGTVDLGLLATPVATGHLRVAEVADEPFVLCMPKGHPLAKGPPLPITAIRDLPVLLMEDGHCLHQHARAACALAGQPDYTVVRSASLSTLAQMVVAGAGVTLLPQSALAIEVRRGSGLAVRPFAPPAPGRTIALAWRGTDPRGAHFADLAREGSATMLPG